jgi:hypothetical protein
MDPITISEKFAAYTWFTETCGEKLASQGEATRFAEENWEHFRTHANKGLGELLIRLSRTRSTGKGRRRRAKVA